MIYINGKISDKTEAVISALDLGVVRGFGIFEYVVTYQNYPFQLASHLRRLFFSLKALNLSLPHTELELESLIFDLLKQKNFEGEAGIRIIVTAGVSDDYFNPSGSPTLIIALSKRPEVPHYYYEQGVNLCTTKIERALPQIKSLSYLPAILAMQEAKQKGAYDALYLKGTQLFEATTANFFAFINGKLVTPKEGILPGVTREIVLKLGAELYSVEERPIKTDEPIEEAFLTSSSKEILPIAAIDQLLLPIGDRTKRVHDAFKQFVQEKAQVTVSS